MTAYVRGTRYGRLTLRAGLPIDEKYGIADALIARGVLGKEDGAAFREGFEDIINALVDAEVLAAKAVQS